MGNQLTINQICNNTNEKKSQKDNKLSKWSKWINSRGKKKNKNNDNFIIKHNEMNKLNYSKIDINFLDKRRVVFVSLIGLYQTFAKCPSFILYSSIFLLPLKQKWLYYPAKYRNEMQSNETISGFNAFSDISDLMDFIELLKWKDKQGGVFWMLDDYEEYSKQETLIHPFWYYLSEKLSNLYDPISRNNYNQLNLDVKSYWQKQKISNNKYCIKTASILNELHFLTMKYKSIQEILYQSNKNSLLPVKAYGVCNACMFYTAKPRFELYQDFDDEDANVEENWWISDDYDPYELTECIN